MDDQENFFFLSCERHLYHNADKTFLLSRPPEQGEKTKQIWKDKKKKELECIWLLTFVFENAQCGRDQ